MATDTEIKIYSKTYDSETDASSASNNNGAIVFDKNSHSIFVNNIQYGVTQKISMTDTSVTISPNIFYVWGEVGELDITLGTPLDDNVCNEYMFQFVSGSTPTTLILPDGISWYMGNSTISANKTYEVSIINNLAVLGEF